MTLVNLIHQVAATKAAMDTIDNQLRSASGPPSQSLLRQRDQAKHSHDMASYDLYPRAHSIIESQVKGMLRTNRSKRWLQPDDACQDALKSVFSKAYQFQGIHEGQAVSWLQTIAKNTVNDAVRDRGEKRQLDDDYRQALGDPGEDESGGGIERISMMTDDSFAAGFDRQPTFRSPDEEADLRGKEARKFEVIDVCTEQACELVVQKAPQHLKKLGSAHDIGGKPNVVRRNIEAFKLCKIKRWGDYDTVEVAAELNALTARSSIKPCQPSSVNKFSLRGAWGCEVGRQRGLIDAFQPADMSRGMIDELASFRPLATIDDAKSRAGDTP